MMKKSLFFYLSVILLAAPAAAYAGLFAQMKDVPPQILKSCQDYEGKIAALGESWNATDVQNGRPSSRFVTACSDNDSWVLVCEVGGRADYFKTVRSTKTVSGWSEPQVTNSPEDPKLECSEMK